MLKNVLDSFGYDVVNSAKKNLARKKKNASGALSNSLDYELKVSAKKDKFSLAFLMEDYGEELDRGVKGKGGNKADGTAWKKKRISNRSIFTQRKGFTNKRPPHTAFNGWTIRRGIAPRNKKGQFTSRKSLLFAIANSVFHTGIEATNFMTDALNKHIKELPEDLALALFEGIDIN
jgi:hypothetical protein